MKILEQPFDYEDFFNYNYHLAVQRLRIAKYLLDKNDNFDLISVLFLLANENLAEMKIIYKMVNSKQHKIGGT